MTQIRVLRLCRTLFIGWAVVAFVSVNVLATTGHGQAAVVAGIVVVFSVIGAWALRERHLPGAQLQPRGVSDPALRASGHMWRSQPAQQADWRAELEVAKLRAEISAWEAEQRKARP